MPPAASDTSPVMSEGNPPAVEPKMADFRWNLDAFNKAHRAWRVETAPADLSTLSDTELTSLDYAASDLWWDVWGDEADAISALHGRVLSERTRRGLDTAFTTAKAGERAA